MGKKVIVHGIPASDVTEYEGMPMFAEVGPLKLDPKVAEQVAFKLQQQDIMFTYLDSNRVKGRTELHLLPNKVQLSNTIELQYSKIDSVSIKRNVNNIAIINV